MKSPKRIEWQFYWSNWWKLWPKYQYMDYDEDWVGMWTEVWFFFGPYQSRLIADYRWRKHG